jgi:hypothetical protein
VGPANQSSSEMWERQDWGFQIEIKS